MSERLSYLLSAVWQVICVKIVEPQENILTSSKVEKNKELWKEYLTRGFDGCVLFLALHLPTNFPRSSISCITWE